MLQRRLIHKSQSVPLSLNQCFGPFRRKASMPLIFRELGEMGQYQDQLPKMPVPTLKNLTSSYLKRSLPLLSAQQREATRSAVETFLNVDGPDLHAKLLNYDAQHENYILHFYRELYTGGQSSSHYTNPNFVLFPLPGCGDAASAGSFLVASALQHYIAVRGGTLAPLLTKKGPLCMSQMPWLYGMARIARLDEVDSMVCSIDSSRHILVLCNGAPYKLDVVSADGKFVASRSLLQQRFEDILSHAAKTRLPEERSVGALTTLDRSIWARERAQLETDPTNKTTLSAIDEALFVVCLDDATDLSPEDMERNVLYGIQGTVQNRWFDKNCIPICADGQAGLNWEHAVLDGHTMMEWFADIAAGFDVQGPTSDDMSSFKYFPLRLELDSAKCKTIGNAISSSLLLSESVGVEVLEFTDFGASFAKGIKCSPDAFVQAAVTLAFYEVKQHSPMVYESVLVKSFKHGRVAVARNTSDVIVTQTSAFFEKQQPIQKIECFRAICVEVSRICAEAAAAEEVDRPLLALRRLAEAEGKGISIENDSGWARFNELDIVTSHCGRPPIRFFGYAPCGGFSVGYYVGADRMQFSINHDDKQAARAFKEALQNMLSSLHGLVSKAQ